MTTRFVHNTVIIAGVAILFSVFCVPFSADAALTRTLRASNTNSSNILDVETGSFTPSNNSLLVVTVGGVTNGSSATPTNSTDVDGGSLTWTKRVSREQEAGAPGWTAWVEIWTAPVTTGASMTVNGSGGGANTMDGMFISVVEYTGYNTASPVGSKAVGSRSDSAGGAFQIMLDGTPATDSQVVGAVATDIWASAGPGAITGGTGWTELHDFPDAGPETHGQVQASSTPYLTTVRWNDVDDETGGDQPVAGVALEIRAGGGRSTLAKPPNNLGLAGYWSFEDATSTKATDFSGNGNIGTLNGDSAWSTGKRGKAITLDGTGDYINAGSGSSISITGPVTVCAWVNPSDLSGGSFRSIVEKKDTGDRSQYFLGVENGTNGRVQFGWSNDSGSFEGVLTDNIVLQVGRWNYVCGVRVDTSNYHVYVDGIVPAQTPGGGGTAVATFSSNVSIGRSGDNDTGYWSGLIDEVRIYNRALGPAEIAALYGKGTGSSGAAQIGTPTTELQKGTSLASGLVGHWTFDGTDTHATIADRSGSNNYGYFSGGATSSAKVSGILGQALSFDNVDDAVVPASSAVGANTRTVCAWVKESTLKQFDGIMAAESGFIFSVGDDGGGDPTDAYVFVSSDGGGTNALSAAIPNYLNVWHHYCTVRTSAATNNATIYVDGALSGSANQSSGTPAALGVEYIGNRNTGGYALGGILDDVRVYNRVLTATEVKQLYNLGATTIRP